MSQRSNARKNRAALSSPALATRPQNGKPSNASASSGLVNGSRPSAKAPSTPTPARRYRTAQPASTPLRQRRGFLLAAGSVVVVAVLLLLGVVAMLAAPAPTPDTSGTAQWPAAPPGSALRDRLSNAGLETLTAEGTALHIHDHLDLIVNGQPVLVPADIGIDQGAGILSPVHTHDATGVIHVESPTIRDFTLGEFFQVWGVRLDANCIGDFCTGTNAQLKTWVNGQPLAGNPADLKLEAHQEIVIAYGTPAAIPTSIPSTYAWNGL